MLGTHINSRPLIEAERQRQVDVEGWTPTHDDQHGFKTLEQAALCYRDAAGPESVRPSTWPWDADWWKPKSRQRNLERAGALYLAASEVADRAQNYPVRDSLLDQVASCTVLLDSTLTPPTN